MNLKERITEDMKSAMRARDAARLSTILLLLAAIKKREIDERIMLDDTQVTVVLDKLCKQRKDSIAAFAQAGRTDLVDKESAELAVLEGYLPQRLSTDEVAAEVKRLIDDSVAFHGQLAGKVGGAFSSSANVAGGNETTVMAILQCLIIHGMVIQGLHTGDHYGPVTIGDLDDRAKSNCLQYGKAVAELAVRLHG
jgi:uncharacterized protein YqeY